VKFTFIDAEKATWPVRPMCRVLGVSPSGFYAWKSRPESDRRREDRRLGVLTREAHERSRGIYGSPRVHAELRDQGIRVSRKRIVRLMQAHGLRGRRERPRARLHRERAEPALGRRRDVPPHTLANVRGSCGLVNCRTWPDE
jgi:transposase InsO family protein